MADEFPHVQVTGVDLAPMQPRCVPRVIVPRCCRLCTYRIRIRQPRPAQLHVSLPSPAVPRCSAFPRSSRAPPQVRAL